MQVRKLIVFSIIAKSAITFVFSFIPNQSNSKSVTRQASPMLLVFLPLINSKLVEHLFKTIIR